MASRREGTVVRALCVTGDRFGNSGGSFESWLRIWSRGSRATNPANRLQRKADGNVNANTYMQIGVIEEDIVVGGGALSGTTTANMLPANSEIGTIVFTPLQDFVSATTVDLGDTANSNTRFGSALAFDQVADGPGYARRHLAVATLLFTQASAAKIKWTTNTLRTQSVRYRLTVFYRSYVGAQA